MTKPPTLAEERELYQQRTRHLSEAGDPDRPKYPMSGGQTDEARQWWRLARRDDIHLLKGARSIAFLLALLPCVAWGQIVYGGTDLDRAMEICDRHLLVDGERPPVGSINPFYYQRD